MTKTSNVALLAYFMPRSKGGNLSVYCTDNFKIIKLSQQSQFSSKFFPPIFLNKNIYFSVLHKFY